MRLSLLLMKIARASSRVLAPVVVSTVFFCVEVELSEPKSSHS